MRTKEILVEISTRICRYCGCVWIS